MSTEPAPAVPDAASARPRNPFLAAFANLLVPPLGHLYVGEAQRGILLALAVRLLVGIGLLAVLALPGAGSLLVVFAAGTIALVVLPLDAFRIARRKGTDFHPRTYNRRLMYVAFVALVLLADGLSRATIRSEIIQAYRMPSESMRPGLLVGDFLFVDKVSARAGVRRGDVIVFPFPPDPSKDFIKRVVGLPGETIEVRDRQVLINGVPLDEPYVMHTDPIRGRDHRDRLGPIQLGPDKLFVLGDNRDNSNDSRYWGPLSVAAVRGKASVIYWSWDALDSRPRWARFGMKIR